MPISEGMLQEAARKLRGRLEVLARTPGAYIGNVACFAEAREQRRIERQVTEGNVIHVGKRAGA